MQNFIVKKILFQRRGYRVGKQQGLCSDSYPVKKHVSTFIISSTFAAFFSQEKDFNTIKTEPEMPCAIYIRSLQSREYFHNAVKHSKQPQTRFHNAVKPSQRPQACFHGTVKPSKRPQARFHNAVKPSQQPRARFHNAVKPSQQSRACFHNAVKHRAAIQNKNHELFNTRLP
jgi:hypothetical protein